MGALSPRYSFVLNPFVEARFTKCPRCGTKTRIRKIPLVIHIDSVGLLTPGKICRVCVVCDLLIVQQAEIEPLIDEARRRNSAGKHRLEYLVLGTVERKVWRRGLSGKVTVDELVRHMADFKAYLRVDYAPEGWCPPTEAG